MNLIKPEKLKKGDTIAIIAPAGNTDKKAIENTVSYFQNCGYKVKPGENLFNAHKYLSATDKERLDDLHNAFSDEDVNAIICARGGYGSLRLLKDIDYSVIRENPKIFCGYSDITALSAMILKNTGLITFSGPMAQSDFGDDDICDYTANNLWTTLTGSNAIINADNLITYKEGEAQGILFGGNLATIASLCGLDFIPEEKFIFFAEDINEDVYKIDKYFRQLINLYKFRKNITGLVLGDFIDNDNSDYLNDLFNEIANELNIPTYSGYPISHSRRKTTIPIGAAALLKDGAIKVEY